MRLHVTLILLALLVFVPGGAARAPIVRAEPVLNQQVFLPQLQRPGVPLQTEFQRQQAVEVVALVNNERAKVGCAPLAIDEDLVEAAQYHSADMADHNYFSHTGRDGSTFVDRLRAAGYSGSPGGENIAAGYNNSATVMAGWMTSQDGHRESILNCGFRTIGVGIASNTDSKYVHYWTQNFGR